MRTAPKCGSIAISLMLGSTCAPVALTWLAICLQVVRSYRHKDDFLMQ